MTNLIQRTALVAGAVAAIAVLGACLREPVATDNDPYTPSDAQSVKRDIADLRRATVRFHNADVAGRAGYTDLVTHPTTGAACLEHPTDGGMGRHMLNPGLVDELVSVMEPEVMIYEPQKDGQLRLVGVEYIIPYTIRGPEEAPPTLFGQEFRHNPTFGLWMFHVYAWKANPAGIFATWNPAITCEFDEAVN